MKYVAFIVVLLIAVEAGVQFWRHRDEDTSNSPVFSWKGAPLVEDSTPPFGNALRIYQADRGVQTFEDLPGGSSVQTLYFEWDELEAGPFAALGGHESDVCNLTAGFKVLETQVPRVFSDTGAPSLEFHYTGLVDPAGRPVHSYKIPWFQGIGPWHIGSSRDPFLRLKRSFIRHRGEARVLQLGVFGAANESEAWEIVQNQLRNHLDWRTPNP